MGRLLFDGVSDGPTIIHPPPQDPSSFQLASQSLLDTASRSLPGHASHSGPFFMNGTQPYPSTCKAGLSLAFAPSSSSHVNPSRKRSHDECVGNEDVQSTGSLASLPTPVQEEPIYGGGMMLLNPRTGLSISIESQAMECEDEAKRKPAVAPSVLSRFRKLNQPDVPTYPSRKAQRLDHSTPDIVLTSIQQRLQHTGDDDDHRQSVEGSSSTTASLAPEEPCVDDFTRVLGISWQRVSHNGDLAPAVRGWEKYIDNHFSQHFQNAQIMLKNRGMSAYLVTAKPTMGIPPRAVPSNAALSPLANSNIWFFLFKEDLSEARLVSQTWTNCLQNLKSVPIVFDSTETFRAADRSRDLTASGKAGLSHPALACSIISPSKVDNINVARTRNLNEERL